MTHDMIHDVLIELGVARTAVWRDTAPGGHDLDEVDPFCMLTIQHCQGLFQRAGLTSPKVAMPPRAR